MKTVGIVGLGIMGSAIATNFLNKGYKTYVWNRTKNIAEKLIDKGAFVCMSPAEVTQKSDIVFEVTANNSSSRSVWMGKNGILAGATKDKTLVTCATLSIDWIDELIDACKKSGYSFFDMALTGGRIGAETGALTLLCGGDEKKLETLKPTLGAIATKILHFGSEGKGMRYKLILNFIQATHIVAFGQAMKIAKVYGMDTKKVGEALVDRPGGVVTGIAHSTYLQDPDPITFSVEWITKDLTYAKKMIKDLDILLLKEVLSEYKKAIKNGHANKDWASINKL